MLRRVRGLWRALLLLGLLAAARIDMIIRRPKFGAGGAIWIHHWCRRFVWAAGVKVAVSGTLPKSGAVVSNHLGYLDILLYSAAQPFIMVAKSEIKSWPLLGRLTAQAGTVYVDRGGGPPTYSAVNAAMAEAYRRGLPVLFFPEGTTTNGKEILSFRRGLFHSILNNNVPLRTAALRFFLAEDNEGATIADDVCWWGDAYLAPHMLKCLGLKGLTARIAFDDDPVEGDDRFVLSEGARQRIIGGYERLAMEAESVARTTQDVQVAGSHGFLSLEQIQAGHETFDRSRGIVQDGFRGGRS